MTKPISIQPMSHVLIACALAMLSPLAIAQTPPAAPAPLNDGPYIFQRENGLEATWFCEGEISRAPVSREQILAPRCGYPHPLQVPTYAASDTPTPYRGERIIAVSDIHGQYEILEHLLRAHQVIDTDGRWQAGNAHMVITGDVFDRGARVTDALWLLQQLQVQARAAGGDVHFLLGNHETLVLAGDLRYINPKYTEIAKRLGRSVNGLYGKDTVLGEWLYLRPVLLKLGDNLFLHGGISPENLELAMDIAATNAAYRASLGVPKDQAMADPASQRYYDGKRSPIWYRGYLDGQLKPEEVANLVDRLGLARIVVGHTTQRQVGSFHGGRIIAIDSGIRRGESGELLFIEDGRLSRGLMDGSRAPLVEHPGAPDPE